MTKVPFVDVIEPIVVIYSSLHPKEYIIEHDEIPNNCSNLFLLKDVG